VCASSSTHAGQPVTSVCPTASKDLVFQDVSPASISQITKDLSIDAWFLALHDKASEPYVEELGSGLRSSVLIDLSSDHRFDPTWVYGQPEGGNREKLKGAKRIANPGCYATGMYITLAPLVTGQLLNGPAHFFGVSGYSGAGTKPSPRNDKARLADNLIPYTLIGHTHERELTYQLRTAVNFVPHVGQWFQGITLTGMMQLRRGATREEIDSIYRQHYGKEPLIHIQNDIPEVRDAAHKHWVTIGGLEVDTTTRRLVTITTLDNLLKGAATQAIQNLNLALRLDDELAGIRTDLQ